MKILVIDDKEEELVRAESAAAELRDKGVDIEVTTLNTNKPSGYSSVGGSSRPNCIMDNVMKLIKSGDFDGVVTDIMFNPTKRSVSEKSDLIEYYDENLPPAGLLVVIACVAAGIPVMICTNDQEHREEEFKSNENLARHAGQFGWINQGWFKSSAFRNTSFQRIDKEKNWRRCFVNMKK